MTRMLSLVLAAGFIAQMMLFSTASAIDIIQSYRVYPLNVTATDDFVVCVQIDNDNPCKKDTMSMSFRYGTQTGYLLKLANPFDEAYDTSVWCGSPTAKSDTKSVLVEFQCRDSLDNIQTDSRYISVSVSSILIHTTSKFEDDLTYGKHVNEPLAIVVYVVNPSNSSMSYKVYNFTLGDPIIQDNALQLVEGQFRGSFVIPPGAPVGFIELNAKSKVSSDAGGKFMSYAAIPYNATISMSGDTIMGNSVNVSFGIDLEYGQITSVNTHIDLPSGTSQVINLNNVNTTANYTIPMLPGTYNIESLITHTAMLPSSVNKTFFVREYTLDIDSGVKVYNQGDTVQIKTGVIDSKSMPINCTVEIDIISQTGNKTHITNSMTTVENKYHKASFKLADKAETGIYNISVTATDIYSLKYKGSDSFTVNELNEIFRFALSPRTFYRKITNLTQGTTVFTLSNTGNAVAKNISIGVIPANLSKYVAINSTNIGSLPAGNSTSFSLAIQPSGDMINGIYSGNLTARSNEFTDNVTITLEVLLEPKMNIPNKTIALNAVTGAGKDFAVTIENNGYASLMNVSANMNGALLQHTDSVYAPSSVYANSTDSIIVKFKAISGAGTYNGVLDVRASNASSETVDITLNVIEDFNTQIDAQDILGTSMEGRLNTLKNSGKDTSSLETDLASLKTKLYDVRNMYGSGQYPEAKSLLSEVSTMANSLDSAIKGIEATVKKCGNGICDDDETCDSCKEDCKDAPKCSDNKTIDEECNYDGTCDSSENCECEDCTDDEKCGEKPSEGGGSPILIIVVIIVVVIIAAVIATSIVPDDSQKDEKVQGGYGNPTRY